MPVADLRSAVAIVTQKPVLFSVLLRDNLLSARPDADWDEVLAACDAAGVSAFVDDLPEGYDTLIGERGVNLSGGQRQRVALARALLAGARVLVLDDPMSAVDTQTERLLVENLRPAVAGRTVLVATQRLSTIGVSDRAVVIEDGRVVEQGAPAELLAAGGLFTALFGDESVAAASTSTAPGSLAFSPTPPSGRAASRSSPCSPRSRPPRRSPAGTSYRTRSTTASSRATSTIWCSPYSATSRSTRQPGCSGR